MPTYRVYTRVVIDRPFAEIDAESAAQAERLVLAVSPAPEGGGVLSVRRTQARCPACGGSGKDPQATVHQKAIGRDQCGHCAGTGWLEVDPA